MKNKLKKGFTLVELVIVVAIIGILIAIAVPKFADATKSANNRKVEANARTISSAVMTYYAQNNAYPASGSDTAAKTTLTEILALAGVKDEGYSLESASDTGIVIKYDGSATGGKYKYSGKASNAYTDAAGTTSVTGAAVELVYFVF